MKAGRENKKQPNYSIPLAVFRAWISASVMVSHSDSTTH